MSTTRTTTAVALKEWGAVAHALLDGRQTVLLRKGGIHEKAFRVEGSAGSADRDGGGFLLFPTVAHSHAERVRSEHAELLAAGAADVDETAGTFVVRCGLTLVEAISVTRPERLDELADLHIWTAASVKADRLDFRPRHPLQALVVRAHALDPVVLPRLDAYGGCKSWVELPVAWDPATSLPVHTDSRLASDAARVHATVGPDA